MVSGSKLKSPSKVSWEVSFSLYYSVICSNCLGNVVVGTKNVEKCGKMWKNALVARFLYTTIVNNIEESVELKIHKIVHPIAACIATP